MIYFDFNLEAHIQCVDGEGGKLDGLVVDPETRQATDLIVERGLFSSRRQVAPISVVRSARENEVYLSINVDELDQYSGFRVIEYEEPVPEPGRYSTEVATPYGYSTAEPIVPMVKRKIHEGIEPGREVIERGMPINNFEGKIGKAIRVVVNPDQKEVVSLVAQQGLIFHDQFVIPGSMIESISGNGISVTATDEELQQLPRYKDVIQVD
jgi:hypothetical protein